MAEVHPVAALFPPLSADELAEMAADIKEHGLIHPIVYDADGRLLDGRNRLAACQAAGVAPTFITYTGDDPLGYCVATNLKRRHLTDSQRGALAVELEPLYADQAKERKRQAGQDYGRGRPEKVAADLPQPISKDAGQALGQAAKAANVSRRTAQGAKRVKKEAPEKYEEVQAGLKTVDAAEREVRQEAVRAEQLAVAEAVETAVQGDADVAAAQLVAAVGRLMKAVSNARLIASELDPRLCATVTAPAVAATYVAEADRLSAWLAVFSNALTRPHKLEAVR